MDVEGAEWDSLKVVPDSLLELIDQMPMEMHGVDDPRNLGTIRRLKKHFHLVNVHFKQQCLLGGDEAAAGLGLPGVVGEQAGGSRRSVGAGAGPVQSAQRPGQPERAGLSARARRPVIRRLSA
jgi:hypothetical protein